MVSEKLCVNKCECKERDSDLERINIVLQAMALRVRAIALRMEDFEDRLEALETIVSDYVDEIEDDELNQEESLECETNAQSAKETFTWKEIKECIDDLKAISEACQKQDK